jgi:hypothetical protein
MSETLLVSIVRDILHSIKATSWRGVCTFVGAVDKAGRAPFIVEDSYIYISLQLITAGNKEVTEILKRHRKGL